MKYSIIKGSSAELEKKITIQTAICGGISAVVILANILLCVFVTSTTHIAFLVINIVTDTALLCFLFGFISCAIVPEKEILKLVKNKNGHGQIIEGKIVEVSENVQSIQRYRCRQISIETSEGARRVFVIVGTPIENIDGRIKLTAVSNIVVEAETL